MEEKKKTWTRNIEGWKNYRGQRSRWSELRGNLKNKKKERKKKKANINPGLYFLFFRHHESVKHSFIIICIIVYLFFFFFFSSFFFFFSRCILGAMWVWSPEKLMREGCILYYHIILGRSQLLFYSSLFYFFRIFIISIYSSDWKWMWRLKRTNHGLSWFFIPGGEEEEEEDEDRVLLFGLSGSSLPQRHYCLGERTSVAFQKSYVRVRNVWVSVCVRERARAKEREGSAKMSDVWILDSIFFEKCSYFSSLGFLWYR